MAEVVTNAVTYRGVDCVTFASSQLRICLRVTSGLYSGLQVRGTDTVVPGLAGRISRNRLGDRRLIEVEGFVQGVGATEDDRQADYETAMGELDAIFDPSLAAGTLVVALQGGGTVSIEARTLPDTLEGNDAIPGRRNVSYRLEAIAPVWTVDGS